MSPAACYFPGDLLSYVYHGNVLSFHNPGAFPGLGIGVSPPGAEADRNAQAPHRCVHRATRNPTVSPTAGTAVPGQGRPIRL